MPNKTVVISGANGYFGGIACQYFQEQGWSVLKATRQTGADIYCDLDHPEQLCTTKIDCHADVFIHAAAAHEVTCREQPYRSIFYNVAGTKAALDFCVLNNIQHFVYLSTFHVFGNPQGIIDESTVPCPLNDYGLSHLQAEQYVQMYNKAKKVKGLVVRPSNFFGIPANLQACDRWTLIPLAFCRVTVYSNLSEFNAPEGCTSLQAEVPFSNSRPLPTENVVKQVIEDLASCGILDSAKVLNAWQVNLKYGYVLYDANREQSVATIHAWMRKNGVEPVGRFGLWQYLWSDQAVKSGKTLIQSWI